MQLLRAPLVMFPVAIVVFLAVLRGLRVITWPWILVFAPVWGTAAVFVVTIAAFLVAFGNWGKRDH